MCVYTGVSLARNVLAKSSLYLAQQHLESYKVAATESLDPNWGEAVVAARTALSFAEQAALSFDAQLSDTYLGSTHAAELLRLCDSRDKAVTLREGVKTAVCLASEGAAVAEAERRLLEVQSRDFNGADGAAGGGSCERGPGAVGGLGVAAHEAVLEHKWAEEQRVEQQRRTSSIANMLKEGNWTLQRCNNHKVFTRRVIKHTDRGASVEKQTFTMSATPSDVRAYTNALTQLRRYDDDVRHVCRSELPAECSAELVEILDLINITQKELDIVKRQARTVDEDKERMEMLLASYQSRLHVIEFGIEWE
jgi:hypothetical protein